MAPFQHIKLVKAIFVEGLRLPISAQNNFKASASPRQPCFRDQAHLSYFAESNLGNISANLYSILVIGYRGDNYSVSYKYIKETSHASNFI